MNRRTGRASGWIVWAACLLLVIAGIALVLPHRRLPILNVPQQWLSAFVALTFGTVGAFLADRRPRHPIPWIFLAIGLSQSLAVFALYGNATVSEASRSAWANILVWLETWIWAPGFVLIPTLLLQLFPTGRPLTERWRWLVLTTLVGLAIAIVGVAFHRQIAGRTATANVPFGYRSPVPTSHTFDFLAGIGIVVLIGSVIASVISIVLRYLRSRGEERDQLKWFATAAVATAVLLTGGALLSPTASSGGVRAVVFVGVPLLPAATAIAVLKYRLYDIDVVINKTLVYGLLAAFITAVYVGIVVGIGQAVGSKRNLGLSILATAVVAVGFQPVRDRVQHLANRLVYGKRATPYEVLSEFSERMSGSYATEDLLPRMARILADGTGAIRADVWLHVGEGLHSEASWPSGGEPPEPIAADDVDADAIEGIDRLLPVRHRGEMLGALSVAKARGDPLRPAEEKLMEDLASGAGLVLRNVRLTAELLARLEELKASRMRIVAAQDEERRKLERNLHDGPNSSWWRSKFDCPWPNAWPRRTAGSGTSWEPSSRRRGRPWRT